ncbi:MAG: tetratricopeptide repeat protein [Vicinamibacteria bacterium]|nr:tetratricopeptide repeat protein [Vicinamibacteria bacterium]
MRRITLSLVAFALLAATAPAGAANREHEQILADIRMLQEQNQRLQLALVTLAEALKTVGAKIDESNAATRKGFADQKLLTDAVAGDLRVLREKLDETNVRLTSLSQDVDGLREIIPQAVSASTVPATPVDPSAPPTPGGTTPSAGAPVPAAPAGTGTTPKRLYDTAYADYTAGQWSLAVQGFETYLKTYPKSDLADDAQYYVGESHSGDSKFREAVAAYERMIRDYPQSDILPEAWYKVGITYERLAQPDRARTAYEFAVKTFPESNDAVRLSKQRLDGLNRRQR